ncbi:MAG TPA: entericidin A/B family lipoprotein [Verrucomicrobiae bacterium]|jgi:predicted small secreted protein|nr:entericidin A/B family lipoprotein [Verrucomicrobiae bacterium]
MKNFVALAMILVLLGVATGCETMHGAGKDIENAGETIQDGSR